MEYTIRGTFDNLFLFHVFVLLRRTCMCMRVRTARSRWIEIKNDMALRVLCSEIIVSLYHTSSTIHGEGGNT
jgi:hypothetical protein